MTSPVQNKTFTCQRGCAWVSDRLFKAGSSLIGHIFDRSYNIGLFKLKFIDRTPLNQGSRQERTPLHWAVLTGQTEIAKCLIAANRSISKPDSKGATPLHLAVKHNDEELARSLIQAKADPFAEDNKGRSPLDLAKDNMAMIRILTGTDKIEAFDSCENAHDFFAVLFPSDPVSPPANWQELATEFAPSDAMKSIEAKSQYYGMGFPRKKILAKLHKIGDSLPIQTICKIMKKEVPSFAFAWSQANQTKTVLLRDKPDSHFSKEARMHKTGTGAEYDSEMHAITVNADESNKTKIYSLFFETINAVQKKDFGKTLKMAGEGKLDREEFAFCKEIIECRSFNWAERMHSRSGNEILENWKFTNRSEETGLISHTEEIRRTWDTDFGWSYLQMHPDLFQNRLKSLS